MWQDLPTLRRLGKLILFEGLISIWQKTAGDIFFALPIWPNIEKNIITFWSPFSAARVHTTLFEGLITIWQIEKSAGQIFFILPIWPNIEKIIKPSGHPF